LVEEKIREVKMIRFLLGLFTISIFTTISCCNPEDSAKNQQTKILGEEELMKKYGPKDLTEAQVDSIIESIEWTTNKSPSILGSKEAQKGGTLTLGSYGYPFTLRFEGENSNTALNIILASLTNETLLRIDPYTFDYIPGLADKWSISADKMTYFFHINENAKWHDETPVRSYDVVATWDLLVKDELKDPFTQDWFNKYERPIALTENIVMVKAKNPEWRLFLTLSVEEFYVMPEKIIGRISADEYMDEYNNKMMMGSGPYTFDKASPNEYIVLKKNPKWWGSDFKINQGLYNFDIVQFIFYTDNTLAAEKFKKGDIDVFFVTTARKWVQEFIPDEFEELKNNQVIKQKIYTKLPEGRVGYHFNLREEPFNDIRVRKSFCLLNNREEMIKKLFFNEYKLMDSYYPNSMYENENNPKIRYNPAEAVKLLEEAGYSQQTLNNEGYIVKDGKVFELNLNNYAGDTRIETLLQEELRAVGIKLNIKKVTWATHIKDLDERNFKIIGIGYTSTTFPSPYESFHSKFADKKSTNNIWGFKNKKADEICEAYNLEFNLQKRVKLIKELDSILTNEYISALNWYSGNLRILYWNKFGMPEFVLTGIPFNDHISNTTDYSTIIAYWWHDEEADKKLKEAIEKDLPLPAKPAEVRYWEKYR
jgi:microcin C transport system substrate-binding protein